MRYLVTGGCGFIGSHLVDLLLSQGHSVRVLDNLSSGHRENLTQEAELMVGDIRDAEVVSRCLKDMDGCFHLAAVASVEQSRLHWTDTHSVNLTGAIRVLEACAKAKIKVVYASSAAVYGPNPALPLSETSQTMPVSFYGVDKLACEWHAKAAAELVGLVSLGMRFFNVYGPRQDASSSYAGVISIFADRLQAGKGITIYGDGSQSRDFIYVGDVVRCLEAGMRKLKTGAQVLNVCTGTPTSLLQLADHLSRLTGNPSNITHAAPRAGDIPASLGNPATARAWLGIEAVTPLEEGLGQLLGARA